MNVSVESVRKAALNLADGDAKTIARIDAGGPWASVGARPVEQKKGADKGIDGRLYFHDEAKGDTKQVSYP